MLRRRGADGHSERKAPAVGHGLEQSDPPRARREQTVRKLHGEELVDDYAWLRNREDPSVVAHLEAENRFTEQEMADTASLREDLVREMLGRIDETDTEAPVRFDGYHYYERTEQGRQYRIHCRRRDTPDAAEEILLDENELAAGFGTRLRIRELSTGEVHHVELAEPAYSLWLGPNREFDTTLLRFHYSSLVRRRAPSTTTWPRGRGCSSSSRRCTVTTRPPGPASGSWPRRRTARPCPSPSCAGAASRWTARALSCSGATARTAPVATPPSRRIA